METETRRAVFGLKKERRWGQGMDVDEQMEIRMAVSSAALVSALEKVAAEFRARLTYFLT